MALSKKSRVSTEFSMSSMTDIIFLLLIFFMLSSSVVTPNALNLRVPSSTSRPSQEESNLDDVRITRNGLFYWNGMQLSSEQVSSRMKGLSRREGKKATITISPDPGVPVEHVVLIMDLALIHNINGILNAEENN